MTKSRSGQPNIGELAERLMKAKDEHDAAKERYEQTVEDLAESGSDGVYVNGVRAKTLVREVAKVRYRGLDLGRLHLE